MAQAFVLRSSDFQGFQQVFGRGADPFLKILKLTRSYWSPLLGRHWSADVLKKKLKLRGIRKNLWEKFQLIGFTLLYQQLFLLLVPPEVTGR